MQPDCWYRDNGAKRSGNLRFLPNTWRSRLLGSFLRSWNSSLARAWFYVPRMMHPGTFVLLEELVGGEPVLSQLLLVDVETLAQAPKGRRAA